MQLSGIGLCDTTWTRDALVSALAETSLIAEADLMKGEMLGNGGFAIVYAGKWRRRGGAKGSGQRFSRAGAARAQATAATEEPVAIKMLLAVPDSESAVGAYIREVKVLAKLAHHPSLTKLHGLCVLNGDKGPTLGLVMELLEGGSLFDWLHPGGEPRAERPLMAMEQVLRVLHECAEGMSYVHATCRIAHRDIKSQNILLTADGSAKISDFGLAREVLQPAAMTRVGSVHWTAPEVLLGPVYDLSCDQWSFAVVAWELLTGQVPYRGMTKIAIVRHVAMDKQRLALPSRGPKKLLIQMSRCFSEIPTERPTFHKITAGLASMRVDEEAECRQRRAHAVEVKKRCAASENQQTGSARTSPSASPYPSSKPSSRVSPCPSSKPPSSQIPSSKRSAKAYSFMLNASSESEVTPAVSTSDSSQSHLSPGMRAL